MEEAMRILEDEAASFATNAGHCFDNRFDLPALPDLLVSGGDDRIVPDQVSGTNRYGCTPTPQQHVAAFGSSTATAISDIGMAAAQRLHVHLGTTMRGDESATYAAQVDRVRTELLALCGLSDINGLDVVLGASGTDLHHIAAQLVCSDQVLPPLIIMVDSAETGSGVAEALRNQQSIAAYEANEQANKPLPEVITVTIRNTDGKPRAIDAVDSEVECLIAHAADQGRRALLVLTDVSKTGLIAPSAACALRLQRRFPAHCQVLVDACQFRLAPASLRGYLSNECMVIITGSKFVTGPSFSGALFIPPALAARQRTLPLPVSIQMSSAASDWPDSWSGRNSLSTAPNFGLLLRWEAALAELKAFRAIPEAEVKKFLTLFVRAVTHRLATDPHFEALPVTTLDRQAVTPDAGWDLEQTIFPFTLRQADNGIPGRYLDRSETAEIYRLLQKDLNPDDADRSLPSVASMACQLGQPVACGVRNGTEVSAVRMCISTRLVSEGVAHADDVLQKAMRVLDKTAWLIDVSDARKAREQELT